MVKTWTITQKTPVQFLSLETHLSSEKVYSPHSLVAHANQQVLKNLYFFPVQWLFNYINNAEELSWKKGADFYPE